MAKGSCLCGQLKYEFSGEPTQKVVCHCLECRKLTGSAFTLNLLVPKAAFKIDGATKKYTFKQKLGDQYDFTITFCFECSLSICKDTDAEKYKDYVIVDGGTLDEGFDDTTKPEAEFFTKYRANWFSGFDGATQVETLP